jgi:hypothetical protein
MTIRYTVAAFIAAALVVASGAVSAAAQDPHEMRVGTMVNITSCVIPSLDEDDEFVLTNIVDSPAHPPIAGQVVYWVSDWKKIAPYVGKRIQFDAKITDVDRKEIEMKVSNGNGNGNGNGHAIVPAWVELEVTGNQVKTLPENVGLSASGQRVEELSIPSTLVRLKNLQNIRTVSDFCPDTAAMRTAALVTETETRTEIVERAAVTEVEIETPAPTPAPVTEVEVETETAAVEIETERTELPKTATPLPLFGLIGFGSLVAAGALRLRRR